GDAEGVTITLREQGVVRRYIIVSLGDDRLYQFILEAPADHWQEDFIPLEKILQSFLFP
ncbi:MAG: hypothetical protein GY805_18405, partial [Chloroflexi bacterium]|nr:hypothetical protein [Chloroflexota bacterium]